MGHPGLNADDLQEALAVSQVGHMLGEMLVQITERGRAFGFFSRQDRGNRPKMGREDVRGLFDCSRRDLLPRGNRSGGFDVLNGHGGNRSPLWLGSTPTGNLGSPGQKSSSILFPFQISRKDFIEVKRARGFGGSPFHKQPRQRPDQWGKLPFNELQLLGSPTVSLGFRLNLYGRRWKRRRLRIMCCDNVRHIHPTAVANGDLRMAKGFAGISCIR